ncbi:Leucyl aminopeptidase (aminopeptidase T) [Caminicella sporogenes DSM 14501]|uniref:Leucyl aminopeptidase (Aminopeptidase T) n=1 Tax=Caminicella sporogenes DSM 14501 TaxID=1121266 RepID=A0A1M6NZ62_9FIRM|nr:aminopeptidase [Caminicella sporogenes]RKD21591.1 aminopeptidase [Caminicella sporogenes]WIF94124.1 aminopeptidase [Caminicella sporogenes]SHK00930.1 Leucyl aminopeptidase (aminopeptidase T) [Caminicella sporogenes DSM 14501]
MDLRIQKLAENLINYSCELKKGERVLIESYGQATMPLVKALVKEAYKVGAVPFVELKDNSILRQILLEATEQQIKFMAEYELLRMKGMDAYIGIRGNDNVSEMGDVPSDKMAIYMEHFSKPVHSEERVNNTKWVVLRYPNNSMAQLANMSLEAFEDFYFNVCNLDYKKMSKAMDNLVKLMEKTDKVHIKGKGTDLTFSIKGIPVIKCDGKLNIPDGEVFTAPVRDSVNGYLTYNCPAVYQGVTYENIRLEFENGKIVKATSNDTERINKVFDTDEGARYIGEFAIGVNPYITTPMKDTLFDEKIMGSFHFTPGKSYDDAPNGNKSAIHWDLVCIQTPEYGGGEIYFDDVLIRKDGRFVLPELEALNPENLK